MQVCFIFNRFEKQTSFSNCGNDPQTQTQKPRSIHFALPCAYQRLDLCDSHRCTPTTGYFSDVNLLLARTHSFIDAVTMQQLTAMQPELEKFN